MFTIMNGWCGFQHHALQKGEKMNPNNSYAKWNLLTALLADGITGLALLVIGGLVTSQIISLSPAAAYAMLAVGGVQVSIFLTYCAGFSGAYGRQNPTFNEKLTPPTPK